LPSLPLWGRSRGTPWTCGSVETELPVNPRHRSLNRARHTSLTLSPAVEPPAHKMHMTKAYKLQQLSGRDVESGSLVSPDLKFSLTQKFPQNYFGLPPYSVAQSAEALAYKSRAPLDNRTYTDDHASQQHVSSDKSEGEIVKRNSLSLVEVGSDTNYSAQRKVARALLKMCCSEVMIQHFLNKGGLDAVLKLISESNDVEVLHSCADCLLQSSVDPQNTRLLLDKQVCSPHTHTSPHYTHINSPLPTHCIHYTHYTRSLHCPHYTHFSPLHTHINSPLPTTLHCIHYTLT
ncbi:hypothetical protein B484DRAFT_242006, partial [Ochromonadaceae sp. CCMP2298]